MTLHISMIVHTDPPGYVYTSHEIAMFDITYDVNAPVSIAVRADAGDLADEPLWVQVALADEAFINPYGIDVIQMPGTLTFGGTPDAVSEAAVTDGPITRIRFYRPGD